MRLISREELMAAAPATHYTKYWSGILDPKAPAAEAVMSVLNIRKDQKPHEPQYAALKWLPDPRLLLDIGANCGQSIVSFRTVGAVCPIKSFEPGLFAFQIAQAVAAVEGNCEVYNFGLSDHPQRLAIYTPVIDGLLITPLASLDCGNFEPGGSMHKFLTVDIAKGADVSIFEQEIELRRGDDLHLAPDIVKIDVEGAELSVLAGFEVTIAQCRPLLLIEKSDAVAVAMWLKARGYSAYRYDEATGQDDVLRKLTIDASTNDVAIPVNVLYIHDEKMGMFHNRPGLTVR